MSDAAQQLPEADLSYSTLLTVIEPSHGWRGIDVHNTWQYRELLSFLVSQEVRARYRQMALGPVWIALQPMVAVLVMSFVFGRIANLPSEGVPYPLFVYVALLPWQFFATGTRNSAQSLLTFQNVISKVYFPRVLLPVTGIATALVDFLASSTVLVFLLVIYRTGLSWHAVLVCPLLCLAAASALGLGLWLAGLSVKYRDVAIGLGFFLTIMQYLTPIAYSDSLVPEQFAWLYELNPMAVVVNGFRWALLGVGSPPGTAAILVTAGVAVFLLVGAVVFDRSQRSIVDLL